MLNNSYFPKIWKKAKVVILPKKDKDMSNLKNHRLISLLPNISKVYEICIQRIINKFSIDNLLLSNRQFGFKYKHSTIHAIHMLTSHINWNWNNKLCTGACLIDMEKAFDNVWIPGLIYKLKEYKFPLYQIILIFNMISDKTFQIFHKTNKSSKEFALKNGLQQGTVNSPILFNLYINNLLFQTENIIAFADDIVIYHSDKTVDDINNNLQNAFDVVEEYATQWKLKINYQKCETILFRPPVNKCNSNIKKNWKQFGIKSKISNSLISNKQEVKYLGVILDKFLYYNKHISSTIEKSRKAFFKYKSLFYSKHVNSKIKILMYQSLIRPILTYACPIWFNVSPSYMEKIRIFERKCLRACTSLFRSPQSNYLKYVSNNKLYETADVIRIDNFIIQLTRIHIVAATQNTENNLIKAPYYADDKYISESLRNGFVPPEAFVFLDKNKCIQNENFIPILYHNYRHANKKHIRYNYHLNINWRYNTCISNKEFSNKIIKKRNLCWWL